jgi:hypothetical protein
MLTKHAFSYNLLVRLVKCHERGRGSTGLTNRAAQLDVRVPCTSLVVFILAHLYLVERSDFTFLTCL